jgi:DNA-binding transcriptional regulator LsrR (DeoR family)
MTQPARSTALAGQIARMYFDRQMTKVEIATHLGISRFRVARLIDGALSAGTVRIEYRDQPLEDRQLASAMESRFGLDLCSVVAEAGLTVPRAAAGLIDGMVGSADVVGVAWGSTMAAVVGEIPARADPSIDVIQLAGSSARLDRGRDAGELARILADRLGGTHAALYAPVFVESGRVRDALWREPEVAAATARFGTLTMAIVGIGAMPGPDGLADSSLLRSGALEPAAVQDLIARGAVGDLVVHPFDEAGRFVAPDLAARSIAIGVEALRAVPRVVAVAAGPAKAAAIRGALATGIIRILVTDATTAQAVLELPA